MLNYVTFYERKRIEKRTSEQERGVTYRLGLASEM